MKTFFTPLMAALILTSCSSGSEQNSSDQSLTLLPDSVNLVLSEGSEIIRDCGLEEMIKLEGKQVTCTSIPFPENLSDAKSKEAFAIDLINQYAETLANKGWDIKTDWPLVKSFEKPLNEECSKKFQIITWLVDETKPVEMRNFESSRLTFILVNEPVCGDKRQPAE